MTTKVKSSVLDAQTQIAAAGGGLTMSGNWYIGTSGLGSNGTPPGTLNGPLNGNATTASTLATSKNINGVGFNGSADITVPLNTTSTSTSGTYYVPFVSNNGSGNQSAYVNGSLYYNPNTGVLNANALTVSGNIAADTGSISWFQPGFSSNQIFKTYQRSDNVLVTQYGSFGAGTGSYANVFNLDSSGNVTVPGTISAANLSGNNTGDQNLSNYVQQSTSPTFTGISVNGGVYADTGSISWFQPGYSSNQIFKTYQRSDNVLVTQYGSFGAGTGSYANVFNLDSSGNVTVPGNVTAYSDITLKDNIVTIKDALNKVTQVSGVTYTRRDLADKQKRYTGVIAQEIESILPEAVMTDEDGIKSVAYGNVIGLLIEAIKELNSNINSLQQQLDDKNNS